MAQDVLGDARAADVRAVQGAEVAQEEPPVGVPLDLAVLLRDDPVEDLDRVVGVAPDRVERDELELLSLLTGGEDQFRHREPIGGGGRLARKYVSRRAGPA